VARRVWKVLFHTLHRGRAAKQADAQTQQSVTVKVVSTDPPYYDNIGTLISRTFFYVWMRRTLRPVYPDLFATVAVPKAEELVAFAVPPRGKENAESFSWTA
jgi:putative DNA methylase